MAALRNFLPRTMFARTLIMIVVPLILVQLVVAFMFYGRLWDVVTRRLAGAVAADTAVLVRTLDHYPEGEVRDWIVNTVTVTTGFRLEFKKGETIQLTNPDDTSGILERVLAAQLKAQLGRPFRLDVWTQSHEVEIDVQMTDGVICMRVPRERLFTSTSYVLFIWMAGSSLIFLLIAAIFLRNQVRPIKRLAAAASAFGKGRDYEPLAPAGATEIRQATAAFIAMRQRIRRFITQRTEMLSAASHDLRTPLTRMKLELEMLGEDELVSGLKTDVADMERLIDAYLDFLRGEGEEQPVEVDLNQFLEETAVGARRSRLDTSLTVDGSLELALRPLAMRRVFDNLISNAARHATALAIRALRAENQVVIIFDDNGPGVPIEKREEVFKPFVRLETSRNKDTGGLGLGLALARDVVLSHGGEITLAESPSKGLRVLIRLPV